MGIILRLLKELTNERRIIGPEKRIKGKLESYRDTQVFTLRIVTDSRKEAFYVGGFIRGRGWGAEIQAQAHGR